VDNDKGEKSSTDLATLLVGEIASLDVDKKLLHLLAVV
jgi:hypothetical protein